MRAEPFESERLTMRAPTTDDAPALFEAYRDPRVMRFWSSPPHGSVAETVAYVTPHAGDQWRQWVIVEKASGRAIGTLAAGERRRGVMEVGYLLSAAASGRGYAREAVSALIGLLFAQGARRVFADTDPDNARSIALLVDLGFQREGLLRAEWETHIGVRDSVIWGLLRDEWRGKPAR
ncbi:GNAT family N-acetyltransferase [Sphingomonas sp. IC4-52]|uniref:GNAT family N-acetyltransferase n=1 Tax=Sphingomonas sp. IC4-52 TaxID=2887202 RepID=UPI001D10CAD9|nr:GNAT family protein [Sphingomonas sp. IC4-52]MCC2980379.1 GNAT family N-acetyltransferase [Sphingomonas sp. IC4-52]